MKAAEKPVKLNARHKESVLDARDAVMSQTKSLLSGTGSKRISRCYIQYLEEKNKAELGA